MFNRNRKITLLSVALTIFMVSLTVIYWYKEQNQSNKIRRQVFNESSNQIINKFDLRLTRYELMLRGVKGFYENSDSVTQVEFHNYIKSLEISKNAPGFQGVAIALHVPKEKLSQFRGYMKLGGYSDFKIHPDGDRPSYVPLSLIEPHDGSNLNAIGYDLFSNLKAKLALEKARDDDRSVLTQKIYLVQDQGKNIPAVVMYFPIYDTTLPLNTVKERRDAILGWVSGPFRMIDFIAGMKEQIDKDLAIDIRDGDEILFNTGGVYTDLYTKRYIEIGGKRWDISIRSVPEFDARFPKNKLSILVAVGFLLSFMFGWLTWLLGTSRERALSLAQQMTGDLSKTKSDLECTLNAIPDVLFELDIEGRYHGYHTKRSSLLVASAGQLIGKKISEVLPVKAAEICMQALHEASLKGISSGQEIEVPFGNDLRWFELSVAKREANGSSKPHFIMISRDVTDRKLANQQLSIAAIAFESQEAIFVTDANNLILRVNYSYTELTGYHTDEVVGKPPSILKSGHHDENFFALMWNGINCNGSWMGEIWNRRKNGELFLSQLSITAVKDSTAKITNYVATMIDITSSKSASDEIQKLAFYDSLTGLPNRTLLIERLTQALAVTARNNKTGGLLFLDIDHFKNINDTLGHDVGDIFLKEVAARLQKCMRVVDTVARLGGDEYVVLLDGMDGDVLSVASDVESCGLKILNSLSQVYQIGNLQYHSTASIGAVLFDKCNTSTEELLKHADIAMYEAKNSGRNALRFFDQKMQLAINASTELERELREAVAQKQFELFYQLQVDERNQVLGAEVLVRWQHPERGVISPAQFIPLAEKNGLILEIGKWVLDTTCAQLKIWEKDLNKCQLKLSVNVSAKQFHQVNFVHEVQTIIQKHNINPSVLNLELTESMLLEDSEGVITCMNELKKLGINFELDDFGTGYSSLQYLKKLPLYQLKIDRSFVRDITNDANDRALVSTIITLSHSLGLKVIAEGVETEKQLQFLKENKCDHFQGFYFSEPLPLKDFEALLKNIRF